MVIALGVWSQTLAANKTHLYPVEHDVQITGASLSAKLADPSGRTVVSIIQRMRPDSDSEDSEGETLLPKKKANDAEAAIVGDFVLVSLTPGKIEQQTLNLVLTEDEVIEFVVSGKNDITLYGNYIDQSPYQGDSESEGSFDMEYDEDDEVGLRLEDVSSDVEVDPSTILDGELDSEDESRFEEIIEPKSAKAKRARDDDEDETMGDVSIASVQSAASGADKKLSKAERKRANKKLKAESGAAVDAAPTPAPAATKKDAKKPEAAAKPESKKAEASPKKDGEGKKKKAESSTLPGGVTITDKTHGSGAGAKRGKKIGVRYIGKLKNGKVFDSNTRGKPFSFTLGAGDVIKGWDEGIIGMQVGGERILEIPAAKAYGKRGAPPDIPGNADLIFEVKLIEVK